MHQLNVEFIGALRIFMNDPVTIDSYRARPEDFTRDRCLTFPLTCVAILKDWTKPADERLANLFGNDGFGDMSKCPTASAFYQARAKLMPAFFQAWTHIAVQFYYDNYPRESLVIDWRGKHLIAIDCTTINLPDTPETRSCYSIHTNKIPDSESVYGLASFAYDVLNDMPINACMGKAQAEKNLLFNNQLDHLGSDTIGILDRGYADYEVVAKLSMHGTDFVIRFPLTSTYKVVEEFAKSDSIDEIVSLEASSRFKRQVKAGLLPEQVLVRLVKIFLDDGEMEVLVTSLLDRKKYKYSDFKWLYGKRWGVEGGFLRFKKQLHAEKFSSGKVTNILQDFHAAVFIQVFEAILDKAEDSAIQAESKDRGLKHVYHVNKAAAYSIISKNLVGLFLKDDVATDVHIGRIQDDIKRNRSPVRRHRQVPRELIKSARRINYLQYRQRLR
jgi:hypothetical protein